MIIQFWRLPFLIQPLVSLSVKFGSETSVPDIISNICNGSPRLQELSLDVSDLEDPEVPTVVMDNIRKLPLQRLRILGSDITQLVPLTPDLANLEYLELDNYAYLTIRDLVSIARYMPKLQLLSLSYLDLDRSWGAGWDLEPDLVTPSPSTFCLAAEFRISQSFMDWKLSGRDNTMEEILGVIAQYVPKLSKFDYSDDFLDHFVHFGHKVYNARILDPAEYFKGRRMRAIYAC
ncbi:hypothetical protein FS749_007980 [Ceratobasidium sp. UAMH 11750]|nr:hypothetical protein FS749_007980 [Ceratobasidium sp. UAMH 11750]